MTPLLNAMLLISTHNNSHRITFLSKSSVDLGFCMIYQHFLNHRLCSLYRLFHVSFSFLILSFLYLSIFFHEINLQVYVICFSLFGRVRMYNSFTYYPDSANRLVGFSCSQEISNLLGKRLQENLESFCLTNSLPEVALVCRLCWIDHSNPFF